MTDDGGDVGPDASVDGGVDDSGSDAIDLAALNTECVDGGCEGGLTPVVFYGIAGPPEPEFCWCTIPCADDPRVCPESTQCQTVADGPGEVCVMDETPPDSNLRWYESCGDSSCREPSDPLGIPACESGQTAGAACTQANERCDADLGCGAALICAENDPKQQPGGCPISRARYKRDIEYVDEAQRSQLAQQVLDIPLATYRYIEDPRGREQLGFIIEDVEPSPGVDSDRDRVNLYGYTSMVVAALQQQQREIERLRQELRELRETAPMGTDAEVLECSE